VKRTILLASAMLYVLNTTFGTVLAIREGLPGRFLGIRAGVSAREDFLVGFLAGWGTALSPALVLILAQITFIALAWRRDRVGIIGLSVSGIGFCLGMLGEPITYEVWRRPSAEPRKALVIAGNVLLPLLTTIVGLAELTSARRSRSGG
jgi:hypothetical protein